MISNVNLIHAALFSKDYKYSTLRKQYRNYISARVKFIII